MSEDLVALRLATLRSAITRLQAALDAPKTEWTRDSAIQRFEFTFELAWKATAAVTRGQGLTANSPREAFKAVFSLGWIDDEPLWLRMLDDRNRTTHTYNEAVAEEIYARLESYAEALDGLQRRLVSPD